MVLQCLRFVAESTLFNTLFNTVQFREQSFHISTRIFPKLILASYQHFDSIDTIAKSDMIRFQFFDYLPKTAEQPPEQLRLF